MERMAQAKEKLLARFLARCESYVQEIEKNYFLEVRGLLVHVFKN